MCIDKKLNFRTYCNVWYILISTTVSYHTKTKMCHIATFTTPAGTYTGVGPDGERSRTFIIGIGGDDSFTFEINKRADGSVHVIGGGLVFASRYTIGITHIDADGGCHVSIAKKKTTSKSLLDLCLT